MKPADQPTTRCAGHPCGCKPAPAYAYTLEQVNALTGLSVDALTKGCRRAKNGHPDGIEHSELAGTRVMTGRQVEKLLAQTAVVPPPNTHTVDQTTLRRQQTVANAQRRIDRARRTAA